MSDNSSLSDVPSDLSDNLLSPPKSPPRHRTRLLRTGEVSPPPRILTQLPPSLGKPVIPSPTAEHPCDPRIQLPDLQTPLSGLRYPISLSIDTASTATILPSTAQGKWHTPQSGPPTRRSGSWRWPHGVLSGGMLIDILECLSATVEPLDWSMARWLQEHFVAPFGRVERLDGLIVQSPRDMDMLTLAYSRYLEIVKGAALVQRLWIPGLEPKYQVSANRDPPQVPPPPRRFERKVWIASKMYYKNGVETEKRGLDMGIQNDEMGWERHLWMAGE